MHFDTAALAFALTTHADLPDERRVTELAMLAGEDQGRVSSHAAGALVTAMLMSELEPSQALEATRLRLDHIIVSRNGDLMVRLDADDVAHHPVAEWARPTLPDAVAAMLCAGAARLDLIPQEVSPSGLEIAHSSGKRWATLSMTLKTSGATVLSVYGEPAATATQRVVQTTAKAIELVGALAYALTISRGGVLSKADPDPEPPPAPSHALGLLH